MLQKNRIIVSGDFGIADLSCPLAAIHKAIQIDGCGDIILDFSDCTKAFPGPMLAICAQVLKLRESGIDVDLVMPKKEILRRLFQNANWAYLISPSNNPPSSFRGHRQIPATQFQSPREQNEAVNKIITAILGALPGIEREDLAALEWSINEITDNVLTHSESPTGGLVQVSTFIRAYKRVEYIVADAGVGIPTTLMATHPEITSDVSALEKAIREGVTRDKSIGQGNGLFGSYQICSQSNGFFQVESGHAKLVFKAENGLHVSKMPIPYSGTLLAAQVDFSVPHLLEEALKFGGKVTHVYDFVETNYEKEDPERIHFNLRDESSSFGSRPAGTPLRIKLANLIRMCPTQKIYVDFTGVPLISSSFADEVFGKLFVELGPLTFMKRIEFQNMATTIKQLLDLAIKQRIMGSGNIT